MAIANPRVHIICGICGCKDLLKFRIGEELNDDTDKMETTVTIICENCASITGLDELIKEEK